MNNNSFKEVIKGAAIVPIALSMVLVPYSIFIGWNLITMIVFWFVIVSSVTLYLPTKVSRNKNHLVESIIGLTIFYAVIVFMIYEHIQSDYFQLTAISYMINIVLIFVVTLVKKTQAQAN